MNWNNQIIMNINSSGNIGNNEWEEYIFKEFFGIHLHRGLDCPHYQIH